MVCLNWIRFVSWDVLGVYQQRGKQFNVLEDETALTLTHAKGKALMFCV